MVADLPDIQRTQRPFESIFSSDKMKAWCSLGPEVDDEADENENDADEVADNE